jgi:hypothetical protein
VQRLTCVCWAAETLRVVDLRDNFNNPWQLRAGDPVPRDSQSRPLPEACVAARQPGYSASADDTPKLSRQLPDTRFPTGRGLAGGHLKEWGLPGRG